MPIRLRAVIRIVRNRYAEHCYKCLKLQIDTTLDGSGATRPRTLWAGCSTDEKKRCLFILDHNVGGASQLHILYQACSGYHQCQVFTGKTPYPEVRFDGQIILKIMNGKRPELPAAEVRGRVGLSLAVWSTMEVCWDHSPQKRPPISHVVKILGQNLHPRKKTI